LNGGNGSEGEEGYNRKGTNGSRTGGQGKSSNGTGEGGAKTKKWWPAWGKGGDLCKNDILEGAQKKTAKEEIVKRRETVVHKKRSVISGNRGLAASVRISSPQREKKKVIGNLTVLYEGAIPHRGGGNKKNNVWTQSRKGGEERSGRSWEERRIRKGAFKRFLGRGLARRESVKKKGK